MSDLERDVPLISHSLQSREFKKKNDLITFGIYRETSGQGLLLSTKGER